MTLFELEFQNFLARELKRLPIPKSMLLALKKKSIKLGEDCLLDRGFWQKKEEEFRLKFEFLFSTLLPEQETQYYFEAIPKTLVPLTEVYVSRREFFDLFSLFKIHLDMRFAKIYEEMDIHCEGRIGCFTWVMPDGFGDWIALKKGIEILKKGLPGLLIEAICLYESSWKEMIEGMYLKDPHLGEISFLPYSKDKPSKSHSSLVKKFVEKMREITWLLQFPTYYIGSEDLKKRCSFPLGLQEEILGQYGFLLAPHFSPLSSGKSMGLHPFEVGMMLRESEAKPLTQKFLSRTKEKSALALAYLKTKKGAEAYLFLIAALQERFRVPVTILMPTFACIHESLESEFFLRELSSVIKGKICFTPLGSPKIIAGEGDLRLEVCEIGPCTDEELYSLASVSTFPIGCRGDQSFTEAVSLKKPFFYDPPAHAANFLIDLSHFAKFYASSPQLSEWFYGSSKVLSDEDPRSIGEELAGLYEDLESLRGDFANLSDLISKTKNANLYLRGRLKRAFAYVRDPSLRALEASLFDDLKKVIKRNRIDRALFLDWNKARDRFEELLKKKF